MWGKRDRVRAGGKGGEGPVAVIADQKSAGGFMPAVRYMKWGRQGILTMIRRIAHESRPDPESPLKGVFTCRTAHELHSLEVPFSRASCAIWPTRSFGKTASPQPRPSSCDYGLRDYPVGVDNKRRLVEIGGTKNGLSRQGCGAGICRGVPYGTQGFDIRNTFCC